MLSRGHLGRRSLVRPRRSLPSPGVLSSPQVPPAPWGEHGRRCGSLAGSAAELGYQLPVLLDAGRGLPSVQGLQLHPPHFRLGGSPVHPQRDARYGWIGLLDVPLAVPGPRQLHHQQGHVLHDRAPRGRVFGLRRLEGQRHRDFSGPQLSVREPLDTARSDVRVKPVRRLRSLERTVCGL